MNLFPAIIFTFNDFQYIKFLVTLDYWNRNKKKIIKITSGVARLLL